MLPDRDLLELLCRRLPGLRQGVARELGLDQLLIELIVPVEGRACGSRGFGQAGSRRGA